jgi:hypothetical protein
MLEMYVGTPRTVDPIPAHDVSNRAHLSAKMSQTAVASRRVEFEVLPGGEEGLRDFTAGPAGRASRGIGWDAASTRDEYRYHEAEADVKYE